MSERFILVTTPVPNVGDQRVLLNLRFVRGITELPNGNAEIAVLAPDGKPSKFTARETFESLLAHITGEEVAHEA
jgi:hypothetical protein